MRRSSVANGLGSLSKVATDMPQHPSSSAVSGPPASTPVSGLPTSSSRQSSRIEAKPRRASTILMPSALLWGIVSENHIWKSARRCSRSANGLAIVYSCSPSPRSLSHPHIALRLPLRRAAGERKGPIAKQWVGEVSAAAHLTLHLPRDDAGGEGVPVGGVAVEAQRPICRTK